MKYMMKVTIANPDTPKGMNSDLFLKLTCSFSYNPNTYGNGHYVSIKGKDFNPEILDIRYDTSFNRHKKEEWLERWARYYWSGKNGAYAVKSITIEKVD